MVNTYQSAIIIPLNVKICFPKEVVIAPTKIVSGLQVPKKAFLSSSCLQHQAEWTALSLTCRSPTSWYSLVLFFLLLPYEVFPSFSCSEITGILRSSSLALFFFSVYSLNRQLSYSHGCNYFYAIILKFIFLAQLSFLFQVELPFVSLRFLKHNVYKLIS